MREKHFGVTVSAMTSVFRHVLPKTDNVEIQLFYCLCVVHRVSDMRISLLKTIIFWSSFATKYRASSSFQFK